MVGGWGGLFQRIFAYKIEFWEVGYLMRSSYKHVVDYLRYFSSSRGVDLDEQQVKLKEATGAEDREGSSKAHACSEQHATVRRDMPLPLRPHF